MEGKSNDFAEGMEYALSMIKSIYCLACFRRFWVEKNFEIVDISQAGVHRCPFCGDKSLRDEEKIDGENNG